MGKTGEGWGGEAKSRRARMRGGGGLSTDPLLPSSLPPRCVQPSPCCGAASVAGAINSIKNVRRSSPLALAHTSVLPLMAEMLREQAEGKRGSLERALGGADVEPLVEAVKGKLEGMGRTLGGKEKNGAKKGCPKKLLWGIVREVCVEGGEGCFGAVWELLEKEREKKEAEGAGEEDGGEDDDEEEEDKDEDDREDEEEEGGGKRKIRKSKQGGGKKKKAAAEEGGGADNKEDNDPNQLMVFDFTSKKKTGLKKGAAVTWKSHLTEMFKKLGGVEKVENKLKPSTGPFGNWGIVEAVKR